MPLFAAGLLLLSLGSPYVPLDSWIYPALDRLNALGYAPGAESLAKPWTRSQCLTLTNQAAAISQRRPNEEAARLISALEKEFSFRPDNVSGARLESIYTRFLQIAGPPLADGYHFGQTIVNDYGRPFGRGSNAIAGFSASATFHRFSAFFRGEYQGASGLPSYSLPQRTFIAQVDQNPLQAAVDKTFTNRFDPLEMYLGAQLGPFNVTFGKQSLWWGPSQGGPMMFSDNALPITMLRIDRVSPFKLPSILSLFGPIRAQFILGQLSGQEFVHGASTGILGQWGTALNPQPFIDGVKLSVKPTPNFEFGVAKTTLVGGPGMPFTLHRFLQSMFSISGKNGQYGTSADAGDRRSEVDFSYKIPGLRDWMTFYGDAFTEDEFSPLGYPRKSAFQGGIYLPKLPRIPKLDLRVEGGSTSPPDFSSCNGCFYSNGRFLSGFTNHGNIMGSWLGRAAQGEQAWSSYWLSARNKIQFNYRHRKADSQFLAGGGTVNSVALKADIWWKSQTEISGSIQYETWNFPALAPRPQSNLTTSLQFTFWPHAPR